MKHIDTIILVNNIELTKVFYQSEMNLTILHDWGSMVIFENRLAFHQLDLLQPQEVIRDETIINKRGNVVIYLECKNIDNEYNRVRDKNIEIIHEVIKFPWGKIFRIKDNDGNIIEIGEEKET